MVPVWFGVLRIGFGSLWFSLHVFWCWIWVYGFGLLCWFDVCWFVGMLGFGGLVVVVFCGLA